MAWWKSGKGLDIWDVATYGLSSEGSKEYIGGALKDVTGVSSAEAAERAASTQAEYGQQALDLQKEQYEQSRQDMMPWLEAGRQGLGTLQAGLQSGAYDMPTEEFDTSQYQMPGEFQFGMEDFQDSPYYQYLQSEGMRRIERSAASKGGLASGATLTGLQQRGQNIAAGEFGSQYNRDLNTYGTNYGRAAGERNFGYQDFLGSYNRRAGEKANQYNQQASLAGVGQVQSQSLGGLGSQYGQQAGQGLQGIGNVKGAGQVGAANAKQQGMRNILGLAGQLGSAYMGGR